MLALTLEHLGGGVIFNRIRERNWVIQDRWLN